jgi:hypothetical protein
VTTQLKMIEFQAVRGNRVIVNDVLAVPDGGEDAAKQEITRRALAVVSSFGSRNGDRVEKVSDRGVCVRH